MDEDNSMTVDWDEFLQHVIINPAENIGELVSSWKHNLVKKEISYFKNTFFKIIIDPKGKLSHHLLTPVLYQMCLTFFLLQNTSISAG